MTTTSSLITPGTNTVYMAQVNRDEYGWQDLVSTIEATAAKAAAHVAGWSHETRIVRRTVVVTDEVVSVPKCREWVASRDAECGNPERARLHPGNTPICGIHARAHIARGAEVTPTA